MVCDGTEWKVGNALYADEARGGELVSAVCAECGYVMRFEAEHISGWLHQPQSRRIFRLSRDRWRTFFGFE